MQQKDKEYKWDFSNLFNSREDWKKELNTLDKIVLSLNRIKGFLNKLENFSQYLNLEKELTYKIRKLGQYLHYGDLDLTNLDFQNLSSIYYNKCKDISVLTSWIAPELKKIGPEIILNWTAKNEEISIYQYKMESFFRLNKYILEEDKEKLLSELSNSRHSAAEIYDNLVYADKKLTFINYQGKRQELNSSSYHEIMEGSRPFEDQEFRHEVNEKWNLHIENHKNSLARIYVGVLQKNAEDAIIRGFGSSLEAELISDNFPLEIYTQLIEIGQENSNLYREFLKIKKKYFNLKKFYGTDCSLKMGKISNKKVTVREAIKIIKESLSILGKEYEEKLELALLPGRIDYYESNNKRKGAYSSGGLGVPPIILMNWDESLSSVNTLIHELGHSIHTLFSEENQTYPNTTYPIILAEIASTFNEHLLFDYLYENSKSEEEKIYLLQNRIEDIIGTFFRQIEFAKFEWNAHQEVEKSNPLEANSLSKMFRKINDEFGGDFLDKKKPKEKRFNWPQISHFFHSPYYVYKYAIAIVASFILYREVKRNKIGNFFKFLKMGGHKDSLEILKDVGIYLNNPKVFEPLLNDLQKMIEELNNLVKMK